MILNSKIIELKNVFAKTPIIKPLILKVPKKIGESKCKFGNFQFFLFK